MLLIILLALPALACQTLSGNGGEDEVAVEIVEPAQSVQEDVQEGAGESEAVEIEEPPSELEDESQEAEEAPAGPEEDSQEAEEAQGVTEDQEEETGDGAEVSAEPEKDSGEIKDEIVTALQSTREVDSMRMHMVTEDLTSGLVTEVTLSFVRPDRYQMSSEGVEFIIIGDTTYMSSGDDQWLTLQGTEMSETVETTLDAFAGTDVIDERQQAITQSDINYEGKETINGVDTLVYSFNEGFEEAELIGQVRMWIGEEDGLLYRQEIENAIAGAETRIYMEFEYGADVTIEPPV
jgi:outer membrane lipoprotein-sorting protein